MWGYKIDWFLTVPTQLYMMKLNNSIFPAGIQSQHSAWAHLVHHVTLTRHNAIGGMRLNLINCLQFCETRVSAASLAVMTLDELSTYFCFYQHRFCSHCGDWWWSRQLCSCQSCHRTHLKVAFFAIRINDVGIWRCSSIACTYFTTRTKGWFSNFKQSTCSYGAMKISRDTRIGSSDR